MTLFVHELRGQLKLYRRSKELAFFTFLLPLILFVLLGSTMIFTTNAPIRRRIRQLGFAQPPLEIAHFVRHLQEFALRSLRKDPEHAHSHR